MPAVTRRRFLSAAAILIPTLPCLHAQTSLHLARIDRARILTAAARYLAETPETVTAHTSPRSTGGPHDFFSEGDYWWPDPAHPNDPAAPYIRRDGFSNPDNFVAHRRSLLRFSVQMPALTAAWRITRDPRYAAHAVDHLRAWFVSPATRMNPNLEHAQAIHGVSPGRGIGVIDTLHLVEAARAATLLDDARLLGSDAPAILTWFTDYLAWLTTSHNGHEERDQKNNHGTCWTLQSAEFARLTSNQPVLDLCVTRLLTNHIPTQIATDGSLPLEQARTKPYSYSLFDLDVLATLAQTLSQPRITLSPSTDLWTFQTPDGRSLAKAMAYMAPFIANKHLWPLKPDVEYFDDLPVRQPSLLFAGLALNRPDYLALWHRLPPDPTVEEIVRNFPIRQPVLWVPSAQI